MCLLSSTVHLVYYFICLSFVFCLLSLFTIPFSVTIQILLFKFELFRLFSCYTSLHFAEFLSPQIFWIINSLFQVLLPRNWSLPHTHLHVHIHIQILSICVFSFALVQVCCVYVYLCINSHLLVLYLPSSEIV